MVLFWRMLLKYRVLALSGLIFWGILSGLALAQERQRNLSPDEPEAEEVLNRELWEFVKGSPYETVLPYVKHLQQLSKVTIPTEARLPTGWKLAPAGRQIEVGNLPYEAISYAGKLVVLNTGFYDYNSAGQEVSIVDVKNGQVIKTLRFKSLFPSAKVGLDGDLYISGGFENKVYRLNPAFKTVREYSVNSYAAGITPIDKNHLAVASLVTADEKKVDGKGQLTILNTQTGEIEKTVTVGEFPYAVELLNQKLYLTVLGENKLSIYDTKLKPIKTIPVGKNPQNLCSDRSRLYVVNTASDNLSVIDTTSR
jgi:DNA-binding beta-propeller fold protein YncE